MARTDLLKAEERGTLAKALLAHPGWTSLVEPFFTEAREGALAELLDKENEAARATVNVVDGLRRKLANVVSAGNQAKKRLEGGNHHG